MSKIKIRDRQTERDPPRETDTPTERERQTDRQTYRPTDRPRETVNSDQTSKNRSTCFFFIF